MALQLVITTAGRAAIVNAEGSGTAPVTITQLGLSATAVTADAGLTSLAGEFKRLSTISGLAVADDMIHLVARDEGADSYAVRSFGLYLQDGTLFAVYGQAEAIVEKTTVSIMLLQTDVRFVDIMAASITFGDLTFINPPATDTVKGVVELSTPAEAVAGTSSSRVPPEKVIKDAVFAWLDARFGANNANILHPNNDGSGSGLDADLLDGQQGNWYSDIAARLGYTPANRAGDTFSGAVRATGTGAAEIRPDGDIRAARAGGTSGTVYLGAASDRYLSYSGVAYYLNGAELYSGPANQKVWNAGNDGAGSGLDADLLDGQDSTYFTNIVARLGYTPLNVTAYTAADVRTKLLTVDGSGSGFDADLLDGQHGSYYSNIVARLGYTPLNASSYTATDVRNKLVTIDGAGSGVDADMLDGQHANAFALLATFEHVHAANGYQKLPNGLIIQWISVTANPSNSVPFNWPVPFPTTVFAAVASARQGLTFSGSLSVYLNNLTRLGGALWANNGGGITTTSTIIAIGK